MNRRRESMHPGWHRFITETDEYDDWWFNIGPSNREPVVRLNIESRDPRKLEPKKKSVLDTIRLLDSWVAVQAE
jgi:phosphomannomutase